MKNILRASNLRTIGFCLYSTLRNETRQQGYEEVMEKTNKYANNYEYFSLLRQLSQQNPCKYQQIEVK